MKNPNELTIENSVLVLIDHQPAVVINVRSIDLGLLVNNVAALSQVAKAFGIPTVLTTVGAEGSVLVLEKKQPVASELRRTNQIADCGVEGLYTVYKSSLSI